MKNKLFQEARGFVNQAITSQKEHDIARAKNSLSSAFANSTLAEQEQLSEMQKELKQIEML
ncbi:DUF3813 domain-containing protein [Jeotgalibacillus soli]|uniref:DUF3813 domain-containing protein n=1 Tax=Jeotgalibacillus soli TaxID=889306 RepID=A0A0C2R6C7_9BACL|nr:DUF3813 domain-containing protein [Jeotgalibacillus soli]KIL45810.1 hypothetical protein KP78_21590 [Jeotgalibacillus soli]